MENLFSEPVFWIGPGAAAFIIAIFFLLHRRTQYFSRVWSQGAEQLKSSFEHGQRRFFSNQDGSFTLQLDDSDVLCRRTETRRFLGISLSHATSIHTQTEGIDSFELHIRSSSDIALFNTKFRDRKIKTGDPDFDKRFIVITSNEDIARTWLDPKIRKEIKEHSPYRFSIASGKVHAHRKGCEKEPIKLEKIARLVAQMSRQGNFILREVRKMTAEMGGTLTARTEVWEPNGSILSIVERSDMHVLIDYITHRPIKNRPSRIFTRFRARSLKNQETFFVIHGHQNFDPPADLAQLPLVSQGDRFSQEFTLLTNDAQRLSEKLSPDVKQIIQALRPALVTSDGREVTVLLAGLIYDLAPAVEALEIAFSLTSSSNTRIF